MKTVFQPTARAQFIALPRQYAADGFWDGICHVDPDPAGVDVAGGDLGTGTPPAPAADNVGGSDQSEVDALRKALANARQFEKNYRRLEAIVGDTNPEKLQELRDADTRLKQEQSERERLIIEAKNSVTSEYKQQIDELQKQNRTLASDQEKTRLTFEVFQEFNQAEGDGTKFSGFMTLANGLFQRTESGQLQVKDAQGRLITTKDEDGTLRPAAPREFMKLLISDKLDGEYDIPNADFLKLSFSPYNKAMGAGLPSGNAGPMPKDLASLTQSQLGSLVFGS